MSADRYAVIRRRWGELVDTVVAHSPGDAIGQARLGLSSRDWERAEFQDTVAAVALDEETAATLDVIPLQADEFYEHCGIMPASDRVASLIGALRAAAYKSPYAGQIDEMRAIVRQLDSTYLLFLAGGLAPVSRKEPF